MKTSLERKVRASLKSHGVPRDASLVVGVSGGADSIALADALTREHRGKLIIAHLNHLLRGDESDEDETFVGNFVANIGLASAVHRRVELVVEREDIAALAKNENRNLEAVARDSRYDFLARAAHSTQSTFVATAHTRDDQVETICMRLIRGTGPEGLRGIYASRTLRPGVTLIRPLLEVTRAQVIEHCGQRGLQFRTDSSNFSDDLQRNRIRHDLLPHLRTFNLRLDEALLRMAALVAEDEELLSTTAANILARVEKANGGDGRLNLRELAAEHPAIVRRVLRLWLRRARGDLRRIDRVHLAAVETLMRSSEGGRRIELPGGFTVIRKRGSLVLEKTNLTGKGGVGTEQNPEPFGGK